MYFLVFNFDDMRDLCLIFYEFLSIYAYKRYANKKGKFTIKHFTHP